VSSKCFQPRKGKGEEKEEKVFRSNGKSSPRVCARNDDDKPLAARRSRRPRAVNEDEQIVL
jgi:hypothetical protein